MSTLSQTTVLEGILARFLVGGLELLDFERRRTNPIDAAVDVDGLQFVLVGSIGDGSIRCGIEILGIVILGSCDLKWLLIELLPSDKNGNQRKNSNHQDMPRKDKRRSCHGDVLRRDGMMVNRLLRFLIR